MPGSPPEWSARAFPWPADARMIFEMVLVTFIFFVRSSSDSRQFCDEP